MSLISCILSATVSLWSLTLLGPNGENPVYETSTTTTFSEKCCEGKTVSRWEYLAGKTTQTVTVTKVVQDGVEHYSFSCTVPQGWVVTDLQFPRIGLDRPSNAKVIVPAGYGAEYEMPENGTIEARYPSVTGGMQMVMVCNEEGTYYFAARDFEASTKTFQIIGNSGSVVLCQQIPASYSWTNSKGEFTLPWETEFVYNEASWSETAQKYYKPFTYETYWGGKKISDRNIVEWVKNADVWIRPKNMFPQVVDALDKAIDYYGPGTGIHWYHWHQIPYDTNYPEYFPPRNGFTQKVAELQAKGAHVTPYTNGRLWDPSTESYQTLKGYLASCRKKDGSLYTEIYPTSNVINSVTCPGSQIWQEVLFEFATRAINELGTDGLYIDQIGAAASEPCYATNHDHTPGGGGWWPKAYRQIIERLRAESFDSNHAITTEENGECYIDLFDMLLIVNTPHGNGVRMVPLFPMIYSDRAVYSGLNYYHEQLSDGHFLFNNARSLMWGAQLGWIQPEWLMKEENRIEIEFLKTLGDFRKKNHDIFLGGSFVEDVELEGEIPIVNVLNNETYPVVLASKWTTAKGKTATILVNYSACDYEVTLPDSRKVTVPAYNAIRK